MRRELSAHKFLTKARGNGLRGVLSRARKSVVDTLSIVTRNAVRIDAR